MEDYKEKYEIGSIVTAKRTYNGEIITGEFCGFHLLDSTNPKSIAGVVHTPNGSYDVEPNSIESVISEDERIRKGLIQHLDILRGWTPGDPSPIKVKEYYDAWISWLEKQSEQKPSDKFGPKFKVGDWCIDNEDNAIFQIVDVSGNTYTYRTNKGKDYACSHYSIENDAHLWTIQDAKDGDALCYRDDILLLKFYSLYNKVVCHCCYSERFIPHNIYSFTREDFSKIHPATREQRDLLFSKMKEAGYEWDAEKKELRKIEDEEYNGEDYGIDSLFHAQRILEKTLGDVEGYESDDGILEHKCAIEAVKRLYKQKSAWSEEDENIISNLCHFLEEDGSQYYGQLALHGTISWLKSIKKRIQPQSKQEWSEEDSEIVSLAIDILGYCKRNCNEVSDSSDDIEKVISWLKSLKDRVKGE